MTICDGETRAIYGMSIAISLLDIGSSGSSIGIVSLYFQYNISKIGDGWERQFARFPINPRFVSTQPRHAHYNAIRINGKHK